MTIEELIIKKTGKTFDEIRAMSNDELYDFIENIIGKAFKMGYGYYETY